MKHLVLQAASQGRGQGSPRPSPTATGWSLTLSHTHRCLLQLGLGGQPLAEPPWRGCTTQPSSQTFHKHTHRSPPQHRLWAARPCLPGLRDIASTSFHFTAHTPSSAPREDLLLRPQLASSPPGCTATPTEVGSSPGQAASTLGSLSEGVRHSTKQHLVLPPGASLFAGEQAGAQGTTAASRTALGGEPDPLMGPKLLGSSASSPRLGGQAPSPRWTFPEAAFNRSICRVYPAMLQQQLPAALAGSAAIGGGC